MISTVNLLELMSARMFHDLAGPIGAINNSLEFFEDENQSIKAKALELIKTSTYESVLRLKFFRQAYGTVNDEQTYSQVVFSLIEEFIQRTKIKLEWRIQDEVINSYIAKTLLNFVIISQNTLVQGGSLLFESQDNQVIITLDGKNIIFSEETKLLLEGDIKHVVLSSTNIQIYYTHLMIETANASLLIKQFNEGIKFIITY